MSGISLPAGNNGGGGVTSLNSQTGEVTITSDDASVTISASGGDVDLSVSSGASSYARIIESQTSGTDGGTFTLGAYRTRVLNTVAEDDDSIVTSLSSNQFTLAAGTYRIRAMAPGAFVDHHKARLQNITDGTTEILGTSADSTSTSSRHTNHSYVLGRFTIASSKTFELQHRCSVTGSTVGFGESCGFGDDEIYTVVELWKEA